MLAGGGPLTHDLVTPDASIAMGGLKRDDTPGMANRGWSAFTSHDTVGGRVLLPWVVA